MNPKKRCLSEFSKMDVIDFRMDISGHKIFPEYQKISAALLRISAAPDLQKINKKTTKKTKKESRPARSPHSYRRFAAGRSWEKGLEAFPTSSSRCELKNDVEHGSWIGAKEVVKRCKPVHISNIASKLLTGRGLISARVERFLLHLPFFLTEMMNSAQSDVAGKKPSRRSLPLSSFKEVKLLIPPFRSEKRGERAERSPQGLFSVKPHPYSGNL